MQPKEPIPDRSAVLPIDIGAKTCCALAQRCSVVFGGLRRRRGARCGMPGSALQRARPIGWDGNVQSLSSALKVLVVQVDVCIEEAPVLVENTHRSRVESGSIGCSESEATVHVQEQEK